MTSSNVNTHFCKGELQRRYIEMKPTLYTCIVCPTQVLRCFPLDTLTLMLIFFFFFFFFFVSSHWYIAEANCKYVLWNRVPDYFFVYLLICIYVHIHTRVKIYAYVILFIHTQYNLCIVPQQRYPLIPTQPTLTLPNHHYNTPLVYIMSICIAHTLSKKKEQKKRKKIKKLQIFEKGCSFSFLQR